MAPKKADRVQMTNIEQLRLAITGKAVSTRGQALEDLIHFLKVDSRKHGELKSMVYHHLLEALFTAARVDQSLLATEKSGYKTALERLAFCGQALRDLVNHGVSKFKNNTVKAVIDHITQTLPDRDGVFSAPLTRNYLEALAALLGYPVHVETLASKDGDGWVSCVDFIVARIVFLAEGTSLSNRTSSQRAQAQSQQLELISLLQSLLSLVSASNAPCILRSQQISDAVLEVLKLPTNFGKLHRMAFGTLNRILLTTAGDDPGLGRHIATKVIPLLTLWWEPLAADNDKMLLSVRDEMMMTIHGIHLYLDSNLHDSFSAALLGQLEDLLDKMWKEYSQRSAQTRLQLTDLTFSSMTLPRGHFSTGLFALRPFANDAERRWAVLDNMACLERIFQRHNSASSQRPDTAEDEEQPRKKPRLSGTSNRLHQSSLSSEAGVRLTVLQLLPFLLARSSISGEEIAATMDDLIPVISDKQGVFSSWAMIACASCAILPRSKDEAVETKWKQVWQLAVRSVSIASTCRAACVLMNTMLERQLLPHHAVADDINNMVTMADICGPSVLVDSSLVFMNSLANIRNELLPSAIQTTSSNIIRWVFSVWKPADTSYALSNAVNMAPLDLVNLLLSCCGSAPFEFQEQEQLVGGPIVECWQSLRGLAPLTKYLLLLNVDDIDDSESSHARRGPSHNSAGQAFMDEFTSSSSHNFRSLVLDLLLPKLDDFSHLLGPPSQSTTPRYGTEASVKLSVERMGSLLSCLMTSSILLPRLQNVDSRIATDIKIILDRLWDKCSDMALASLDNDETFELMLSSISPYLPRLDTATIQRFCTRHTHLLRLCVRLSELVRGRAARQASDQDQNAMEVLDEFESQVSDKGRSSASTSFSRDQTASSMSMNSHFEATKMKLHLLAEYAKHPDQTGLLPMDVRQDLLSLEAETFLNSRSFVRELLESDLGDSAEYAIDIVEKLGEIMYSSKFTTCDTALCTCVEILTSLASHWSMGGLDANLNDLCVDLYNFLVKTAWPNQLLSTNAQLSMAALLYRLTEIHSQFWRDKKAKVHEPRVTLLDLLSQGSMVVKFSIGMRFTEYFDLYAVKEHETIFLNIIEHLPSDSGVMEGIALRVFILANLGSNCPTLLRRCVFHIVEVPEKIPDSAKYATHSMRTIATARSLKSPQELLQLFAPQIFYTWLENDPIDTFSYDVFGFATLDDLLAHVQTEAAALMIMRGQDEAFANLAARLNIAPGHMIQQGFAKVLAYSLGHDTTGKVKVGQSLIKKVLGRELFYDCVNQHFADIVAEFFTIINQEDAIEDSWAKDPDFAHAAETMAEIRNYGVSLTTLPRGQQPNYKGQHLVRYLGWLLGLTAHESTGLWTHPLVACVGRRLFNTIHPALGPHHALSVIRKVRILVCLAGPQAASMYPLEMLLRSIRPLISDPECADEALGITQWLLVNGSNHLAQAPSFLAGYALSTLASLRMFLESSQSSASQESQFKATIDKAHQFHTWFVRSLKEYTSPSFKSETQAQSFRAITESASNIRTTGNSQKDTHESRLLLEILKDAEQDDQLLNDSSRDLALRMLCSDFRIPRANRNDILESDADACVHSPMVWKSCRAVDSSKEYLTWAGRVVGRAFAASGNVPADVLRESLLSTWQKTAKDGDSIHGLLRLLSNLTLSDNSTHAGLAESASRRIVSFATFQGDQDLIADCSRALPQVLNMSSNWASYSAPPSDCVESSHPEHNVLGPDRIGNPSWAKSLAIHLATSPSTHAVCQALTSILDAVDGFAEQALPYIIHLVLFVELDTTRTVKKSLTPAVMAWLRSDSPEAMANLKILINVVLYLRSRMFPAEVSIMDRSRWLDVDSSIAAAAATRCGMFKVALMFAELALSDDPSRSSRQRRSSTSRDTENASELLLEIFENIDDPDAYYGLERPASITNVLARLEYEKEGGKSLAFRGAQYDSHVRGRKEDEARRDGQSLVKILSGLGLAGLSDSLLQSTQHHDDSVASLNTTFTTARKLEKWNLPAPPTLENHAAVSYRAYQSIHKAVEVGPAVEAIREGLASTMKRLVAKGFKASDLRQQLGTLAALTELDDVLGVADASELEKILVDFEARSKWMMSGRYDDVSQILSHRQTTLSLLSQKDALRTPKVTSPEARLVEVRSLLLSSRICRFHQARQEALSISTALRYLVVPSEDIGITIDAAVRMDEAHSLWEYGEMISSIRVLQGLHDDAASLKKQNVPVSHAEILSKIGYQVSVAKLETADSIQKKYLEPALKVLKGAHEGQEAGEVFHRFAIFCDEQLQDPEMLDDLTRLEKLVKNKTEEVDHYKLEVSRAGNTQLKQHYARHLNLSQRYLKLDQDEAQLVQKTRNEFVKLSLENYLQALTASDNHDNDALRFTALWLERSENDVANSAVEAYLKMVPTRKFVTLMNQLSSRMQRDNSKFQMLLMRLVLRICSEHPYHGIYQIWAGTMAKTVQGDHPARLRKEAAKAVADRLNTAKSGIEVIYKAIDRTNGLYTALATSDRGEKPKSGSKINVKDSPAATQLASALSRYRVPPPTLELPIAADKDYSRVPIMAKLEPTIGIAGGISAPKILTVVASNGERYKQLVKGGNDDLRQDAIMEQVFAAVSSLLKQHRTTRQRNLGIRTYKVLPLTPSSGIIEFVANTQPLHDWLIPAHSRYYPKLLKGSQCRKQIEEVQDQTTKNRIAAYRKATDQFPPVMRYFFLESSPDPDDWYARRLAYTRSTAAVSILGHVLGLGDRHGHNILLDKKTGEAVHIDLGVAFEAGRILPIPEVVPFRMTRDVVDGMGITKTDGVFRRCCEFTLDALREDTYSIMTILDVLRYDPLYSWSSTPMRLARLQNAARRGEKNEENGESELGAGGDDTERKKKVVNEPSEADRALEVVRKKLSKTLSVTAMVNDLINQATDEKNLAVLYAGWAAYA